MPQMRTALAIITLTLVLMSCRQNLPPPVAGQHDLVVAIRESPTTYQRDGDGTTSGFEYDLISEFARHAGLKLSTVLLPSDQEMYRHLAEGKAHFAAGWLSAPRPPSESLRLTRTYHASRMAVVRHEASLPVLTPEQLSGRPLHVAAGSHLAERLRHLQQKIPGLSIVERPDPSGLELLRAVAEQKLELVVTDEPVFDIAQNIFPELEAPTLLGESLPIGWLFPASTGDELYLKAQAFLAEAEASGLLARLKDRYFGHVHRLDSNDALEFLAHVKTRLPKYQALFKKAQILTGIDWRTLAALAYQESNWDPLATSPTNVRGIMMLTEDTADRLQVTDRLDPEQSILAGARYLADLRDMLPASVREPDRTWMALAAYNLGMGHLNGARQIARGMKVDVDQWYQLKKVLPLMSRPEYYSRLKSGRARGGEAVILVENIRAYVDILQRHLPSYDPLTRSEARPAEARRHGTGLRPPSGPSSRPVQ